MTEEQYQQMKHLQATLLKVRRRIRKKMADVFPAGSEVTFAREGVIISGKVRKLGEDAENIHVTTPGGSTYHVSIEEIIRYQREAREPRQEK